MEQIELQNKMLEDEEELDQDGSRLKQPKDAEKALALVVEKYQGEKEKMVEEPIEATQTAETINEENLDRQLVVDHDVGRIQQEKAKASSNMVIVDLAENIRSAKRE